MERLVKTILWLSLCSVLWCSFGVIAASSETQQQNQSEEDESVIDSVTDTIGNAIGILTRKVRTEGEEGIPRTIAVLPATGQGDDRERDDIRTAIFNGLSSKNFELLKPYQVDTLLAQLKQADGSNFTDLDPQDLADKLDVEGLVYVDVPLVEQIYAAAYAHYKITVKLSFYSVADNNYIWEKTESTAEREGGISLNPLSFIAQAISSAQVLTEAVRQSLVDKLARIFAAEIPFPIGERRKIKPVKVDMAISNVAEGPFRAGDEISVFMRAEPRLAASFDIGNKFVGLPMTEQEEGAYVGRYVVSDNDNAEDLIVRINAIRVKDKAQINWRVPGRIGIDTIVPEAVDNLESSPVKDGIRLSWPSKSTRNETLTYHVERADPQSGKYEEVAAINIQEYIDRDIVEGTHYHYRIYAQDEAKNQSPFTNIQVAAVGAGPTMVNEDILSDTIWYPVASPYIIKQPIRLLRGARLTISPGTIIRFEDNGKLEVLGQIQGLANSTSPIVFEGENLALNFANTGDNKSVFKHTKFNGGNIIVEQSSVDFIDCELRNMQTAVAVNNNGKVSVLNVEFAQNDVGIKVEDGNLTMNNVKLLGNKLAWQALGRMDVFSQDLRFEDNEIHIQSERPMTVNNAVFTDLDYQGLMEKLKGDIKVDFSGVAEKHNLLAQWLKDRWMIVLESAKHGLWLEAHDALFDLKQHVPNDRRMENFYQTLRILTNQEVQNSNDFLLSVQRFKKRGGKGELWVHEVKLPFSKSLADSDSFIKKQAAKKISVDYLKRQYPELRPAQLRKYRRKVKIDKHVVDNQVIYASKKGLFLHVWLANYLDMEKVGRSLTMAGLVKKANSELMVGLLSQSDVFELEELVVQALQKQGIKYVSIGSGSYGMPARKRAEKEGANVVLEIDVRTEESVSGLSKNLKMANVNLVLDLYDVETNSNIGHLSASDDKAGFKLREIVKKAVTAAYGTIESQLLAKLWAADDIVTEHKKVRLERERKERIAREKARKAKAEQERLARLKAEQERKARLAREKAAKERIAREKAEQERIAKEKAQKAELERLAKLAAATEAQAPDKAQDKDQSEPPPQSQSQEKVLSEVEPR